MRRPSGNEAGATPPPSAFIHNPKVRGALYQLALVLALGWLGYQFALNTVANLGARNIASGLGFFNNTAGFGINLTLIPYDETATYGRAFVVGLLNTLMVSGIGIVLATLLGFTVGIGRLSSNWLMARIAGGYVEVIRNLPLLFQILFWYLAVLGTLPGPRQSLSIFGAVFLNNRGLVVPEFRAGEGFVYVAAALGASACWPRSRSGFGRDGCATEPDAAFRSCGRPWASWSACRLRHLSRRACRSRWICRAFKASISSAAPGSFRNSWRCWSRCRPIRRLSSPRSCGPASWRCRAGRARRGSRSDLRRGQLLRLILLPQALRIIVPPLTNQYLNLTKNSSLAVAIGYPDLFAVFAGTTLNQTGQAIEIIAITMAVYLSLSLATSMLMNWYNSHVRSGER